MEEGRVNKQESEFMVLAMRYLDSVATDEDMHELASLLANSSELREAFVDVCIHVGVLNEDRFSVLEHGCAQLGYGEGGGEGVACLDTKAQRNRPGGAAWMIRGNSSLLAPVAVLAAACLLLGVWLGRGSVGVSEAVRTAPEIVASRGEVHLTAVHGCTWGGGSDPAAQITPRIGDELVLNEGIAELLVLSESAKTRLSLEGPLSMTLASGGMPSLRYGRLTVAVSDAAGGDHHVETAFGRFSFRGSAEIGVYCMGADAEVHVFTGSVQLDCPWLANGESSSTLVELLSGEAIRIEGVGRDSPSVVYCSSDKGGFVPSRSMESDNLLVSRDYISAIRSANPVAYWRFEGIENGVVKNEMGDRFNGVVDEVVQLSGPRGNRALLMGMSTNPGRLLVNSDSWDDVVSRDFSVEMWLKPSHYHYGALLSFVGRYDEVRQANPHGILVEACGIPNWKRDGSFRFLHRPQDTMDTSGWVRGGGGISCYSSRTYTPRQWQHVVALRRNEELLLHVDGVQVGAAQCSFETPKGMQLVIGQLYSQGLKRFFVGQLDEVAVYDRALTPEEIEGHYHVLRPAEVTSDDI